MALWVYGFCEWENSLVVCWMRENDRAISLKAGKNALITLGTQQNLSLAESLPLTPNMKVAPYLYFATDTHCGLTK